MESGSRLDVWLPASFFSTLFLKKQMFEHAQFGRICTCRVHTFALYKQAGNNIQEAHLVRKKRKQHGKPQHETSQQHATSQLRIRGDQRAQCHFHSKESATPRYALYSARVCTIGGRSHVTEGVRYWRPQP
eukprot:1159539-Pelagomonas_calceolata.AAC.10